MAHQSATLSKGDSFDLYKLPRELRDAIYDKMLVAKATTLSSMGVAWPEKRITIIHQNIIPNNALAINHQFHSELKGLAAKSPSVEIHHHKSPNQASRVKSRVLPYVQHAHIHLLLNCDYLHHVFNGYCCVPSARHRLHTCVAALMRSRPVGRSILFTLYVCGNGADKGCEDKIIGMQERFLEIEGFEGLELYRCDIRGGEVDHEAKKKLIMSILRRKMHWCGSTTAVEVISTRARMTLW